MGLSFITPASGEHQEPAVDEVSADPRRQALHLALCAQIFGSVEAHADAFTDDVTCWTSRVSTHSRRELATVCDQPEQSLAHSTLTVRCYVGNEDTVAAEWDLEGELAGTVLFDDDLLIEPHGERLRLRGVTFARFRGEQVCDLRHYFEDVTLLSKVSDRPRWQFAPRTDLESGRT